MPRKKRSPEENLPAQLNIRVSLAMAADIRRWADDCRRALGSSTPTATLLRDVISAAIAAQPKPEGK
jgi:hypothetical protein